MLYIEAQAIEPRLGTVIRRAALETLSELFDPNFHLVEEADVFCRIGHDWEIDGVAEPLTRYRIHGGGETWKNLARMPVEREALLQKLLATFPDIETVFAADVAKYRKSLIYQYAQVDLFAGRKAAARRRLLSLWHKHPRSACLYVLSFMPEGALKMLTGIRGVTPT